MAHEAFLQHARALIAAQPFDPELTNTFLEKHAISLPAALRPLVMSATLAAGTADRMGDPADAIAARDDLKTLVAAIERL